MGAYPVYLVLEAVRGLGLGLIVVAPIFRIEVAGFGPLELVLAGTALEVAYFSSEVPTGIVADLYSRRLSVIIGAFVMGGAWVLEAAWPVLWPIMVAQALLGTGWTFFSGATEAWIAGELGETRAAHAIVRARQGHLGATVVGMFGGAALGTVDLRLPILAGGLSHLALALFLVTAMPEAGFVRGVHASTAAAFRDTLRGGARAIRTSSVLLTILLAAFLAGMASEGLDRLWEAHLWSDIRLPSLGGLSQLYWFALIGAGATVLSVGAISFSRRWVERESDRGLATTLVLCSAAVAGGTVLFGLTNGVVVAIAMYWAARIARNVAEPAYTVWIVRNSPPELRATVISMEGQSHAIGEIASGPPLGAIGRLVSIPAALVASGALQALTIPLLARAAARSARAVTEVPVEALPLPETPGTDPSAPEL